MCIIFIVFKFIVLNFLALECQLENEHEERTTLLKERHELERRLAEAEERLRNNHSSNQDLLHKLKRDLKRTKVLLRDAQMTIEQTRGEGSNKAIVRQLRNQVRKLLFLIDYQGVQHP